MTGKRRRYGAEFKARIMLEALRGELTTKHGIGDYRAYSTASAPCRDPSKAKGVPEGSTVQIPSTMSLGFFGAIVR